MKFLSKLSELFKDEPVPVVEAPKVVELKKRTKKLVSSKQMVDIGVTVVRLQFEDGREMMRKVYGKHLNLPNEGQDQGSLYYNVEKGLIERQDLVDPSNKEVLVSSIEKAENFLKKLPKTPQTYVDDPRKPTHSMVGKVISAQIIKTEQCLEEVTKYSVEPI